MSSPSDPAPDANIGDQEPAHDLQSVQVAAALRYRKRLDRMLTPVQRMEKFAAMQREAFRLLQLSPEGYANFIRRNHHNRRAHYVNGVWEPVCPSRPTP